MLIIPFHQKLSRHNLPLLTLALVFINVLVFLLFQLDDDQEQLTAGDYYESSGLAEFEFAPYRAYVGEQGDPDLYLALSEPEAKERFFWFWPMQTDIEFQRRLHGGEIVHYESGEYADWHEKRLHFEALFEQITYVKYGLRTAEPTVASLFTHMFLHAGFSHLIGNMLFLMAVGFLVELTLDSKTFLFCYLLGGLGSTLFNFVFQAPSLVPGIGASGAIAGLMGMYAVLYGLRKIRFLYFIVIYFDYVTLPAIALLPLWVGNELFQMWLYPESNINFMAHASGLISGALLALLVKRFNLGYSEAQLERDEALDHYQQCLHEALALYRRMDLQAALPLFRRLHHEAPEDREVLLCLYGCSKLYPMRDEYHELSRKILMLRERDAATNQLVLESFREYLKLAQPKARLTGAMVCQLAERFIDQKALAEAERLVRVIAANKAPHPKAPQLLLGVAKLLEAAERGDDAVRYVRLARSLQQRLASAAVHTASQ